MKPSRKHIGVVTTIDKKKKIDHVPKELLELVIDTRRYKEKRSSSELLLELRYGHR